MRASLQVKLVLAVTGGIWLLLVASEVRQLGQDPRHGVVAGLFAAAACCNVGALLAVGRRTAWAAILPGVAFLVMVSAKLLLGEPWGLLVGNGVVLSGLPAVFVALTLHGNAREQRN